MKQAPYPIFEGKEIRVIIDTDAGCECDDHYAIAQALMTPKFDVVGICAEHFSNDVTLSSGEESFVECEKTVALMGLTGQVPVCRGSAQLAEDGTWQESDASRLIVAEALKDDVRPLYILLLGAVTNVAVAFLQQPEIQSRVLLVGGLYPTGHWWFNSCNDYRAYNVLLDSSAEWWTVDAPEGLGFRASMMRLYREVRPCGALGEYLYHRTLYAAEKLTRCIASDFKSGRMGAGLSEAARAAFLPGGEAWAFWDCATVGLAMNDHMGLYTMRPAPRLVDASGKVEWRPNNERQLRCYPQLDSQLIMEDLFAKLAYYFG